MSLATGIDMIEIERLRSAIQRHGERFLGRIFTPLERQQTNENPASLAGRFAAKEAAAKALGTGIGPVAWQEIEILYSPTRQPEIHLHGNAAEHAKASRLEQWAVSISHTQKDAIAVVVAMSAVLQD